MSLAGTRITDEALKVRWRSLLLQQAQNLLKIFRANNIDELLNPVDEIVGCNTASIMTIHSRCNEDILLKRLDSFEAAIVQLTIKWQND